MRLTRIKPNSRAFGQAWEIYASSFPRDERREKKQLAGILRDEICSLFGAYEGSGMVGFIGGWELGRFFFIEHFAVKGKLRGRGIGSKILAWTIRKRDITILEAAKPKTGKEAVMRIKFYRRMGFVLNRYKYVQPSYAMGKKSVPFYIMSHPRKLGKKEFLKAREIIHRTVYGQEKPFLG